MAERRPWRPATVLAWLLCGAGLAAALFCGTASATLLPPQIHTVAGGGACTGSVLSGGHCDDIAATSVPIEGAQSVSALPGGGFLYIDAANDLVREVTSSGKVITVAGNGSTIDAPDGSVATQSGLDGPVSVAALPDGGFLVTEYDDSLVRMVSPGAPQQATITTIAGTGEPGYNGDGIAASSQLNYPTDAEPAPNGGVLIADEYNNLIRLVSPPAGGVLGDPGATLTTVAGGGSCDDLDAVCDGMPATSVQLYHPYAVSALQDGSGGYLIDERDEGAIREVASTGTFSTVAGTPGEAAYIGDGGPAVLAQLNLPTGVASLAGGGFLIADTGNNVVREVDPAGVITTIAGDSVAAYTGDGGAATAATLDAPTEAAPFSNGNILIADSANGAIREVTIPPVSGIFLFPPRPSGSNGWYTAAVLAIVAADEGATLRCELDPVQAPPAFGAIATGCPFVGVAAPVSVNGQHVLWAASENSFGDQENPVSVAVNVDTTPPTVTCPAPPAFAYGDAHAVVTATVSDAVSGAAAPTVSSPVDTMTLGTHTVVLVGANNAGLSTNANCTFKVVPDVLRPTPVFRARFRVLAETTRVLRLLAANVPAGSKVAVQCTGGGCPFERRVMRVRNGACAATTCSHPTARSVVLTRLFRSSNLAPGVRLVVTVTRPGTTGRVLLINIRSPRPVQRTTCIAPGAKEPGKGC